MNKVLDPNTAINDCNEQCDELSDVCNGCAANEALDEIVFDLVSCAEFAQLRHSNISDIDRNFDEYEQNALRMKLGLDLQKELMQLLHRVQTELVGLGSI